MVEHVTPIRDETFDCLESIVISMAIHWKREFILMFAESWDFEYLKRVPGNSDQLIGQRIGVGWKGEKWELLKKYHGVQVEWFPCTGSDSRIIALIQDSISAGQPIGIGIDVFNCPWDLGYQKYSFIRHILLIGIDDNEQLICLDPYVASEELVLPLAELEEGICKIVTFHKNDTWIGEYDWKEIVHDAVNSCTFFNLICEFAEEVEDSLDLTAEVEGFLDIHTVALFEQLKKIALARRKFGRLLKYFGDRFSEPVLLELAQELEIIADLWTKIRLKLTKLTMLPQKTVDKKGIAERIRELAKCEEVVAQKLLNKCKK